MAHPSSGFTWVAFDSMTIDVLSSSSLLYLSVYTSAFMVGLCACSERGICVSLLWSRLLLHHSCVDVFLHLSGISYRGPRGNSCIRGVFEGLGIWLIISYCLIIL